MLLSVIVPVYNAEKTLRRCLDSLLQQGIAEDSLEILCVDDGSTDCSLSILEIYAEHHSCIKVFTQQNVGVGEARNIGLSNATGEVLTFCDADDYMIPGGLDYLLQNFWNDKLEVLCHGSTTLDAKKLSHWQENNDVSGTIVCEGAGREIYERDPKYFVWNALIRRSFWESIGLKFQPMTISEDSYFMLELMMQAKHVVDVSSNIYRYTVSEQQVTHRREPELMRRCLYDYLEFMNRLQYYSQDRVLQAMKRPFYSRALSAAMTKVEYETLKPKVQDFGIKAYPFFLYYIAGWLFRTLFIPLVLPHISRG